MEVFIWENYNKDEVNEKITFPLQYSFLTFNNLIVYKFHLYKNNYFGSPLYNFQVHIL